MWTATRKTHERKLIMKKGLVIKSISGEYTVLDSDKEIVCKPRGVFRHKDESVKVGDICEYDETNKIIYKVDKRKNDLIRPVISNVDIALVVTSVKKPQLNLNLLDKIITMVEYNNIRPILIFTKIDLLNDLKEFNQIKTYYQKIGYSVYLSNDNNIKKQIINEIENKICVLVGQSGVGKSSLLNSLNENLKLKTNEISNALGRGKHTTRHIELFKVGKGFIADSPGFGNLDVTEMDLLALSQSFVEFFSESCNCKYSPCFHIKEPNCAVKDKINKNLILKSRYENYLQFATEIKEKPKY